MKKKFGHYEVISELGRGGMGVVYKAFEPTLNRYVAIKALGEHLLNDDDLIERFTREAKSMAAINHPNVIQVYYIGKEGKQPYFAMEFLEGISLDELLTGQRILQVGDAKNILRQACAGLSEAHKHDLVHRDIKPANLMVCVDGSVKVVDFGIAQTREYGDKLTNTGEFVGTPGYLSPEVCTGQEVDKRSDIFALGIVFYEMLAGKVPFENDSPLGLMLEVVQSEIPDIRGINKKVDKKTHYILEKMIAKNPEERFQDCAEIIQQLGPGSELSDLKTIKAHAIEAIVKPKKVSQQVTQQAAKTLANATATTPNNQRSENKKSAWFWKVAAVVLVLAGGGVLAVQQGYLPNPLEKQNTPINALMSDNQETMSLADVPLKSESELQAMSDEMNQQHEAEPEVVKSSTASTTNGGLLTWGAQLLSDSDDKKTSANKDSTQHVEDNNQIAAVEPQPNDASFDIQLVDSDSQSASVDHQTKDTQLKTKEPAVDQPIENTDNLIAKVEVPNKTIAQQAQQKSRSKPVIKRDKGVAVLVFGDPAVANPIKKIIESELKSAGIKVMNEQFVPGLSGAMAQGFDMADVRQRLDGYGGQQLVVANVNFVGEQMLEYYGRQSVLVNAQLDVDSYDLASGDSLGSGYGSDLKYTSLNATQVAQEAVMGFVDRLKDDLKQR
ncbi:serine/threonine-protein kinase [Marinicella gelatinilytica]|uniref:serine/threonine-protein kinase n=1 Tax=Marinicella gelatinilytica TaxID=2996017 RepID=UPI0022609272|nr:serine/threonine-protein kinase [Marinicella gelatinilytica]MCX7545705.1 serine/threonine-protein kinase [Marinicella gelatinilytica]